MTILVISCRSHSAWAWPGSLRFWSLKNGQYDDLRGAAVRILSNDDLDRRGRP